MRQIPGILVGILLFLHTYTVLGEGMVFRQVNTREGLSQNTVRTILSDRQGFIWAGTVDGLNRYDGNNFIIYKPRPGAPSPLSDHRIKELHEDRDGYIWVKMYNNSFTCYDPQTERFIEAFYEDKPVVLNFTEYAESNSGKIWLWGRNGCARLGKKEGKLNIDFLSTSESSPLTHHYIYFMHEDSRGNFWAGSLTGLNKIAKDGQVTHYYEDLRGRFQCAVEIGELIYFITTEGDIHTYDQSKALFAELLSTPLPNVSNAKKLDSERILLLTQRDDIWIYHLKDGYFEKNPLPGMPPEGKRNGVLTDSRGGIWFHNHTGNLWYCNPVDGSPRRLELIPSHIVSVIDEERYNVFIDSRGNYWITTYGNGLFRYDPTSETLENYTYQGQNNSLASDYLLSITEDHAGNIWVGTEYAGMSRITPQQHRITFIHPENDISSGASNNVRVIFEDNRKNVWVGTKNGSLYLYDRNLENGRCVRENMNPYAIVQDSLDRIWIGTKGHGLVLMDPDSQKVISWFRNRSVATSISHNAVFHLLKDREGRVWVATFGGGLCLVEEKDGAITFRRFFNGPANTSFMRCLYQDSSGDIWAGTYEGLIRFTPGDFLENPEVYHLFQFEPENVQGLNCNDIKTIYESSAGDLWIGTAGGGINKLVKLPDGNVRFEHYTSLNGLPGDMVTAILEGPDCSLWISTESGLAQFMPEREHFIIYRFSENPYGNFYNENACILRYNGDMLWGTLDGMLGFNPRGFVKNSFSPRILFTDLYLFDQRAVTGAKDSPLSQSVTFAESIRLKHSQNTFTIGFALLNLTEPELNRFSYILEPYDKTWSSASKDYQANYKNLPPGRYIFSVIGSNADGEWTATPSRMEIRVLPPFWKSVWAYLLYIILAVILLYIAYRLIYKFNHLNNAVQMEKQLTDYKLRFFTNISHEFRTPLTLISGVTENLMEAQSELPVQARNQIRLLDRNTRQMRQLIDQLLEFRKIQNTTLSLNLEKIDLEKFIWEIYTAFRETASQKTIDYRFNCQLEEPNVFVDREKVEKILFNLLSNAFKFTPNEGLIEVRIMESHEKKCWKMEVRDNGCGIPKEKQHLLFSRFMQINFSAGGTGVGLSLVKEMVDIHKGEVWYTDNESQGSVFCVEIPATAEFYSKENFVEPVHQTNPLNENLLPDPHSPIEVPEVEVKVLSGWKILVIDDNPDILDFLYAELSKYFQVDTAANGRIGLEKAIETSPNLIICDIMMPEMDGFEMTRQLKEEFETCHIPIILLTAHSSMEHQLEGVQSGADFYITKPFSLKYLLSKIYKLIEHHEKLKKRYSAYSLKPEKLLSETDQDNEFYQRINRILEENLGNPLFSVDEFTELAGLRRTVFYKKLKGLTGFTPNELIKIKRMKRAAELLATGQYTVSEVSWKVGIEDQFYFSKCFKAQFGCTPSKFKETA